MYHKMQKTIVNVGVVIASKGPYTNIRFLRVISRKAAGVSYVTCTRDTGAGR